MENLTFLRAWRAHFFQYESFPLSQGERGIGQLAHFASPFTLSQFERPLLGERGMGRRTHFVSFAALRVTAGGRNP